MSTPEEIVEAAKCRGTRRSAEYWQGALAALRFRMQATRIQCPYREETAQFDDYFSGIGRGHVLWRECAATLASGAVA